MKKVKLLGELGKKFGRSFNLDIKSPAEAIRALRVNFPDFEKHLLDSDKRGVGYRVIVGKSDKTVEELYYPSGKDEIKIVPVIQGAGGGGGVFNVIAGAVLVAVGYALTFTPLAAASPYLINAGIALAIGGVIQMLTPVPNLSSDFQNNQPDNKPSYTFNGSVNTTAQGYPVPIGYGRMIVGSAVISAGISVEDI